MICAICNLRIKKSKNESRIFMTFMSARTKKNASVSSLTQSFSLIVCLSLSFSSHALELSLHNPNLVFRWGLAQNSDSS